MTSIDTFDIDNENKKKIREAFDLFDKEKKGCVIQEEVSTIMRTLGVYPSERDIIRKILPEMQEDEPSAFVTYESFEKRMLQILQANEYAPDSEDTLLAAFRALDPEKNGYVDAEMMIELLTVKGTPFREKEIEGFLAAAKDADNGRIYYEDYIALLMSELQN